MEDLIIRFCLSREQGITVGPLVRLLKVKLESKETMLNPQLHMRVALLHILLSAACRLSLSTLSVY